MSEEVIITDPVNEMTCPGCGSVLDVSGIPAFTEFDCPECENELTVPGQLGHFLLLKRLGSGGMGSVYLAEDQTLKRQVALKVMHKSFSENEKAYGDFRREAQATAKLNHKNVVQVYSLGEEKQQPYIVMEFVDGGHLDHKIEEGKPIPETLALAVCKDVAEGLHAASANDIIHGDIKPGNIMFGKHGDAKVVDFGLARFVGSYQGDGDHEIWGTPFYIAPEKVKQKKEDFRSDQYSLGATLWHALGGRPPFKGETTVKTIVARIKLDPPDIREANPKVSERTAKLLLRMMARSPNLRYPNYTSLIADVQKAQEELQLANVEPAGRRVYGGESLGRQAPVKKSYAKHVVSLLFTLLLGGAAAVYFALQEQDQQQEVDDTVYIYKIVDGKRVKVPVDEMELNPPDYFFPIAAADLPTLNRATSAYVEGSMFQAEQLFQKVIDGSGSALSKNWLWLIRATTSLLDQDKNMAVGFLKKCLDSPPEWEGGSPPIESPENIINFFTGKLSSTELEALVGDAATWYQDVVQFFLGVGSAQKGDIEKTIVHLSNYVQSKNNDPQWAYTWEPIAKKLLKEAELLQDELTDDPDPAFINEFRYESFRVWDNVLLKESS